MIFWHAGGGEGGNAAPVRAVTVRMTLETSLKSFCCVSSWRECNGLPLAPAGCLANYYALRYVLKRPHFPLTDRTTSKAWWRGLPHAAAARAETPGLSPEGIDMPVKRLRLRALPGVTYQMPITITKDGAERPFEISSGSARPGHCGATIIDGMTKLSSYAERSGME